MDLEEVPKAASKRCGEKVCIETECKKAKWSLSEDVPCPINDLPSDILIQIFKCLPLSKRLQVSQVCKLWHSLVNDQALWQRICLQDQQKVCDSVLLRLTTISNHVTFLNISCLQHITAECFVSVLQQCCNLRTLKAFSCSLQSTEADVCKESAQEKALAAVGKYCQQLTSLILDSSDGVTDLVLESVAHGCPKLRTLHIGSAFKVSSGVCAVAKQCPLLTNLNLSQCHMVNDDVLEALSVGCPDMECLNLSSTRVTQTKLYRLARFKKLRRLEITHLQNLAQDGLVHLVAMLSSNISNLSISLCSAVTDKVVEAIAHHLKNLKSLYLVSCSITDQAMIHLANHARKLENLDVSWCNITDAGAVVVSEKCRALHSLSLMRCDRVTVKAVKKLVKLHPQIHYSTMDLDYRRLLRRAKEKGCLPVTADIEDSSSEDESSVPGENTSGK